MNLSNLIAVKGRMLTVAEAKQTVRTSRRLFLLFQPGSVANTCMD